MKEQVFIFEEQESRRSSLELLYHVSRELAKAIDLRTVLQRVLQLSLESVDANSGSVIVLDDKGNPLDSAIFHSGQMYHHTTRQLRGTLERGLAGWVARNRRFALIQDTSKDPRWARRPDDAPDRTGAKSAVSAPLLARERLVGVITLVHPTPGSFTREHGTLVQAIADIAGIAVMNARLYAESKRQAEVMTALAESAVSITASLGTEDTLNSILDQVHEALHVEAVSLALIVPEDNQLEIMAARGPASEQVIGIRLDMGQGVAGWVAQEGKATIVSNARENEHFEPDVDRKTGFETRSIACAPIRAQGKVIGVLEAFNPIEGAFSADALLVLTGIGSLTGSVILHAQLFESLQAAHQSFQDLFEDSIDPIFITDWEGKIVEVNRQAVQASGTPKERLQNLNIRDLHQVAEEDTGKHLTRVSLDQTLSYESELSTNSEVNMPVQVNVRQIVLDEIEYLQWIMRDITERKRLDTLRDDLISMIYHDLRSPLANVIYSMDVLQSMLPDDDPTYKSLIDVAVRSTERIQRLTSSLLDLKKLEAGQPIINRTETNLREVFNYAVDAIYPIAESKQQSIRTELPEGTPNVFMDSDMIRRVIINIMENAVKYTPMDGSIVLGAKQIPNGVQIWVQDNGPGIPAEKAEKVFDKFARLHSGGKGLGLGLAFCRLAVEGHGGNIWVESDVGQGSMFTFTLPIMQPEVSLA